MISRWWWSILKCCEGTAGDGRRVGVHEESASWLLATASRTITYKMILGVALVALEPVAIGAKRVLGTSKAHSARPALALAFALALPEADEHGVDVVVRGLGEEGTILALALAAFAEPLDDAADAPRRLVAVEAPPTCLGAVVGPEQLGGLLALGQVLDVAEVLLLFSQRACSVGVSATAVFCNWERWGWCRSGSATIGGTLRVRTSRAKG